MDVRITRTFDYSLPLSHGNPRALNVLNGSYDFGYGRGGRVRTCGVDRKGGFDDSTAADAEHATKPLTGDLKSTLSERMSITD